MILKNRNGEIFKLDIKGYRYPFRHDNKFDANWLIVNIDIQHSEGTWVAEDACLMTFELSRLANWLLAISDENQKSICKFSEPNLEFHKVSISDKKMLRVYFETMFRPEWAPWDGIMHDLWLDFDIQSLDMYGISHEIMSYLTMFPERMTTKNQ